MTYRALSIISENKKTRSKYIDLGKTGLTEIPKELFSFYWLEVLVLSNVWEEYNIQDKRWETKYSQNVGLDNNIEIIDKEIIRLKNLKKLVLSGSFNNKWKLSDLKNLASLPNLQLLFFDNTGVSSLEPLSEISSLVQIYFDFTIVSDLTPIENLNNLKVVSCQHTPVQSLLPIINLSAIEILYVRNTKINDISSVRKLIHLREIYLSNTSVNDLSPLSELPDLEIISCHNTEIQDISPLLWLIKKGKVVSWSEGLGDIRVLGCPLSVPPPEIVRQGNESIINYFQEIEVQDTATLYEAKLLLIGDGGAGKTSLCRRLIDPSLPLPIENETTRGIDIYRHHYQLPNGKDFRINIWDFGGQEIYHATHQFFLTERSLYVLLDDTRMNHKTVHEEGFKYWLEVVDLLSGHSPVLIYQNEKGGRSKQIDIQGIKGRFDNVKEVYKGNLAKADSADTIRDAIQLFARQLPHIGEKLPAKWIAIREEIETWAKNKPYISEKQYFEIYAHHLDLNLEKALLLSRYLHDLGVFLHFQDDALLRRTVVLQNQWATDAVFQLLDDESVRANFGRFDEIDCERLWPDALYSDMHLELRALMLKFELCYQLPDVHPAVWLVPQLLPLSRPSTLDKWEQPGDMIMRFSYDFLPKGMISRLMVRKHYFVHRPDLGWQNGVLFEQGATQLLAEVPYGSQAITLRARGPESNALLSVIVADLDALNTSFNGLSEKVKKEIPCNCTSCRTKETPEFYDQQRLLKRKVDGKFEMECPISYEKVNVLELLDGISMLHLPSWAFISSQSNSSNHPITTRGERTLKIFLASSSELHQERDAFDLYFRQQNDRLRKRGIYLEIIRWEYSLDAMSETRLQDEYNRAIRNCDIFVSLFFTKTGKYTEEEFDVAHTHFKKNQKPLIYTFFRNANIKTGDIRKDDLVSLLGFKEKLRGMGHFHTEFDDIEHLKRQFRDQLDILLDEDE